MGLIGTIRKTKFPVLISLGRHYPQKYETGKELKIADDIKNNVYVAGAKLSDDTLLTAGGRVLGVTAVADDLKSALSLAYERVNKVNFSNAFYRKDIGKKALEVLEG